MLAIWREIDSGQRYMVHNKWTMLIHGNIPAAGVYLFTTLLLPFLATQEDARVVGMIRILTMRLVIA